SLSAFASRAPAKQKSSWRSRPWTPSPCPARADVPSGDRRSWWRIAGMIGARSALPCGAAASACAARPGAARPPGEPSGGDGSWPGATSIVSATERSFAWLENFRRLLIRWEQLSGVYEDFFTVAVLFVCRRRVRPAVLEEAGGDQGLR